MFNEIFHDLDLVQWLTRVSLLIFVLVFVGTLTWIVLKSSRDVSRWATLPLDEDTDQAASSVVTKASGASIARPKEGAR